MYDVLATIAPRGDMIKCTWILNAELPGHGREVNRLNQPVNYRLLTLSTDPFHAGTTREISFLRFASTPKPGSPVTLRRAFDKLMRGGQY